LPGRFKLFSNAVVIGNITSASISIETGAVLQGNVSIKKEGA
jgi:cytoskeletal protein CcmA (bactofilin family)